MAGISSILCLAVMAGVLMSANAVDYCNLSSCRGPEHTMCKYKSPAPGPACNQPRDIGLTPAEKTAIVNKHNELRQRVASGNEKRGNPGPQPAAASMPNLQWDNELETVAQRLANQCIFAHDKCRNVERFAVGQNIAISWAQGQPTNSVETMTEGWYEEVKFFNRNDVSSYKFAMNTGHYSQFVWGTTTKIGCGRIKYTDRQNNMDTHLLVCNYGPAGNWQGEKVYKTRG